MAGNHLICLPPVTAIYSLNPNSSFSFSPRKDDEVAVFVTASEVDVNGIVLGNSKMLLMEEGIKESFFRTIRSMQQIFSFSEASRITNQSWQKVRSL